MLVRSFASLVFVCRWVWSPTLGHLGRAERGCPFVEIFGQGDSSLWGDDPGEKGSGVRSHPVWFQGHADVASSPSGPLTLASAIRRWLQLTRVLMVVSVFMSFIFFPFLSTFYTLPQIRTYLSTVAAQKTVPLLRKTSAISILNDVPFLVKMFTLVEFLDR